VASGTTQQQGRRSLPDRDGGAGVEDDEDGGATAVELGRGRGNGGCTAAGHDKEERVWPGEKIRCARFILVPIVTRTCTMYRLKM
jgi:hypothetical protein